MLTWMRRLFAPLPRQHLFTQLAHKSISRYVQTASVCLLLDFFFVRVFFVFLFSLLFCPRYFVRARASRQRLLSLLPAVAHQCFRRRALAAARHAVLPTLCALVRPSQYPLAFPRRRRHGGFAGLFVSSWLSTRRTWRMCAYACCGLRCCRSLAPLRTPPPSALVVLTS